MYTLHIHEQFRLAVSSRPALITTPSISWSWILSCLFKLYDGQYDKLMVWPKHLKSFDCLYINNIHIIILFHCIKESSPYINAHLFLWISLSHFDMRDLITHNLFLEKATHNKSRPWEWSDFVTPLIITLFFGTYYFTLQQREIC